MRLGRFPTLGNLRRARLTAPAASRARAVREASPIGGCSAGVGRGGGGGARGGGSRGEGQVGGWVRRVPFGTYFFLDVCVGASFGAIFERGFFYRSPNGKMLHLT